MKFRIYILLVFFFLSIQSLFSQETFNLKGKLIDSKDSLALIVGGVYLMQDDSLINFSSTNDLGEFEFQNLKAGKYSLKSNYYYFPSKIIEINLPKDTLLNFFIEEGATANQLKKYKFRSCYTIYYYGLPVYSDDVLNVIGEDYSVKWMNLGCVGDKKYDKYNLMIKKILAYKNGNNWETDFWNEVSKEFDK